MPGDDKNEKVLTIPVATYKEGAVTGDLKITDIDMSGKLVVRYFISTFALNV